jgi:subtilisin-like proprotein convertase family protein/Zn-dependent metalloprotease
MSRFVSSLATLVLVATVATAAVPAGLQLDTRHIDHRDTPKVLVEPQWPAIAGATPEGTARAFLDARAADFGVDVVRDLHLVGRRESLLAHHFTFQQLLDGVPVELAEVIVSVAKRDGRVMRAFNNAYPVADADRAPAVAALDQEQAYDAAWRRVRATGHLRSTPSARLVHMPVGADFRLEWVVGLDLSEPAGAWQVHIDAQTGQVVEVVDRALMRLKTPETERPIDERIAAAAGPLAFRPAAFAERARRDLEEAAAEAEAARNRANGTGLVFDPDPRTTLRLDTLQDGSAASAFTDAYFTRDLLDITYNGSVYSLTGPWVNIVDWDAPTAAPSTTTDGNWDRARGNNSFNDAMTYFHLDQNQRYMQSLGFTGAMGIQDGSIVADTHGVNGADNSYYVPASNRLSFGHGCVDDNEDADVIIHEYGHAINHDINSSWYGGDTGAMGEGWGDYWGGSYSYSTPNGPLYRPDWIYSWDGHGAGNLCWYGRILNATGAQYVHSTTYGAHVTIPGGYQSDELWSTPLYQTLRTLVETHGQTRESVDRILLESQFGLGSGLKMRDMANIIIATAGDLEPGGPHAGVFVEKFLVHNIILQPLPAIGVVAFDVVSDPNGNGAADPGETVAIRVTLNNSGLSSAASATGVLSCGTLGVDVIQDTASYGDLVVGGESVCSVDYTVSLDPSVACGTIIPFNLQVAYDDGGTVTVDRHAQLPVGAPIGGYGVQAPYAALPDDDGGEIRSTITFSGTGATVSAGLNMDIEVIHDYVGDLVVWLTSPSGTRAYLSLLQGGSADNIVGNYPGTLTPAQSFDRFIGEPLDGDWELMVRDSGAGGTGHLNWWGLYDISDFDCDADVTAIGDSDVPVSFALGANAPNPFNPATTISFAVPQDAGVVTLAVYDVAGRMVRTLEHGRLAAGAYRRTWQGRDDAGRQVGSGVYFYKLTGDGFAQTRKMVLVQ